MIDHTTYFISVHLLVYYTSVNTQTFHYILFRYQVAESCVKSAQFYHTKKKRRHAPEGGKLQKISCESNNFCSFNTVESDYKAPYPEYHNQI